MKNAAHRMVYDPVRGTNYIVWSKNLQVLALPAGKGG
jgi:hypothetical protein